MRLKLIISFVLFCIVSDILSSKTNQYGFSHIDVTHGLSHNQINCIYQDKQGFMWFGTMSGLNRYDGYTFKIFRYKLSDTNSINDNYISKISEDNEGNLWVNTRNGYCVYNTQTESFIRNHPLIRKLSSSYNALNITNAYTDKWNNFWLVDQTQGLFCYDKNGKIFKFDSVSNISKKGITSIVCDFKGNLWTIDQKGILDCIDIKSKNHIYRNTYLNKLFSKEIVEYALYIDNDNDIWITAISDAKGLFYFNRKSEKMVHFTTESEKCKLSTNILTHVVQANDGIIWIGTDHGGINLINKKDWSIRYLYNVPDDDRSLSQNSITYLYKDSREIIWAGTFKKGINYYHENICKFKLYRHLQSDPGSLCYPDINCFTEDKKGNLWIGTNGGGLIYFNRSQETFTSLKHKPNNPNSLSSDVIVNLLIDKDNLLWIGTFYGGLDIYDGSNFRHYCYDPLNPFSISDNRIWKIFEDSKKNIWIGTLGGGLELYDRQKKIFKHYHREHLSSSGSAFILSIDEDKDGDLWIGTADGLDMFEHKTGRLIYYVHNEADKASLSNNNVTCIKVDNRNLIWVGTREGLNMIDKKKNTVKSFRKEDGLPDNSLATIIEDKNGNLWLGTRNGLCNLIVLPSTKKNSYTFKFINYDESDGLQGREFSENSAYITHSGELAFGGSNGFNLFYPEEIKRNELPPNLIFTDLQIFNKSIKVNEKQNGRIILKKSITETQEISLKYSENVFSIEFAVLSFFHPEKCQYSYKMNGFDNDWLITNSDQRKATYTNLDPGEYIFQVKATNNDGIWNNSGISLRIKIKPPLWRTPLAYIFYFALIILALIFFRASVLKRERDNRRIEQEKQETARRQELDMLKIKFFTNVSHEFRTPLTLIISPVEKMLKTVTDPEQNKQVQMIYRNTKRLLNLVNELLEFRKMEVQEIKLDTKLGDVVLFVKDVVQTFASFSEKKNINLSFNSYIEKLFTYFDHHKLERILFNLLSNAFKFTRENGSISVNVRIIQNEINNENPSNNWFEIKVSDTGIGIPPEKHEKIFERFFQNDLPGVANQGSGIGLSIVKEFVKLHGGHISVESQPDKGSCFTILLPIYSENPQITESAQEDQIITNYNEIQKPDANNIKKTDNAFKPQILIVEDNADFRFYLKDSLSKNYRVYEAPNGKEGWTKALAKIPDLILSDIMMPDMSGVKLCRQLKNDTRTSHIPVILLTALSAKEQQVEGFNTGADDYIVKPFNYEILESRIKNLILQRKNLQKTFQKQIVIKPSEITVTSLDEKLLNKALEIVEKHMTESNFSVLELSRELGMSRVHLYKKLLSLTGKTPIEFIRILRLKRAAQFLAKSQMSVSEVAYKVGFNNPKYFTRYFKAEFNVLPSEYNTTTDKSQIL